MATPKKVDEVIHDPSQFSVYRMKGSDKLVIRKKGGPTREQVLKSERYERTRENTTEFTGVGIAVRSIRFPLLHVKHLADFNFTSRLTNICSEILKQDKTGARGQRSILLSENRHWLESFSLNKTHAFQSIVASPVSCTINRNSKSAVIKLPRLTPGINVHLPWKQPLYRFSMSLGLVPDIVYEDGGYNDHAADRQDTGLDTEWQLAATPFPPQTVELKLNTKHAIKDSHTLVLAIGIGMGKPGANGTVEEVKRAGSAYILAVG
ncbi:hypothetical protein [uncultured Chitinophaga sp.]|jgi:hypothetical protein|uniref:hypothetical protein n=1 Tax=uncultured Chitinophaga sp. TaxID=339340 RepID=UPI0026333D8A|nr:hypothetical protein [uncultured Chitinophaga sp.]